MAAAVTWKNLSLPTLQEISMIMVSLATTMIAKKVSFDSFLKWLKLGDAVGKYIKDLFNEYI